MNPSNVNIVASLYRNCQIFMTIILAFPLFAQERYPWKLTQIYETFANFAVCGDIDNDGVDEIVECHYDDYVAFVKDQSGNIFMQYTSSEGSRIYPVGVYDLDSDNRKEIVFCVVQKDSARLVFCAKDRTPRIFTAYTGRDIRAAYMAGYDTSIHGALAVDVNGDGCNDLICFASTGFDLYPRGVFVYDYKNNRELWHHWIGVPSTFGNPAFVVDIDNDQKKEIIFGTSAPANGAVVNEIDDSHTWVIVLGFDGRLRWKKRMHEHFSNAVIWAGDLNNNNDIEIVVGEIFGSADKKEPNMLSILDAKNGETKKYIKIGEKHTGMKVFDINRDGKQEIITSNTDGKLRIFDKNLELISEKSFETGIFIIDCIDFDNNGTYEILLTTNNSKIVILDEKLNVLCSHQHPTALDVYFYYKPLKAGKIYNIMATSDKNIVLYKIEKSLLTTPNSLKGYLLTALIILLIVTTAIAILSNIIYRRNIRQLVNYAPIACMLIGTNNKLLYANHKCLSMFGGSRENLISFLHHPKICEDITRHRETKSYDIQWEERNMSVHSYYFGGKRVIILVDTTSEILSRDLMFWSALAQQLAHEIKNPLSTLNLTLQRMQQIGKDKFGEKARTFNSYIDSALEEIERLKQTTDRFMRILSVEKPNLTSIDINRILGKITQTYESVLPREIKIKRYFQPDLPLVRCDENQIHTAFHIVIENAIEAMQSKGVLSIHTSLIEQLASNEILKSETLNSFQGKVQNDTIGQQQKQPEIQKCVEITFEDTGCGMSAEQIENLFKPFHSTKKGGTGLGLVIARKIIDAHNGKIDIKSRLNVGTIVSIILPV